MSANVFLYGTLKRGQRSHHLLKDQRFLGEARTAAVYRLFDTGRYPCLVEAADGVNVHGEIWEVSDEVLLKLDAWENVPELYSRKPITLEDWKEPVWAYVYNGDVSGFKDCGNRWQP
jgi:gamma-glutamylcyclotransferase (GGCT)/AIG2-like uncharacterized protein YtfP